MSWFQKLVFFSRSAHQARDEAQGTLVAAGAVLVRKAPKSTG